MGNLRRVEKGGLAVWETQGELRKGGWLYGKHKEVEKRSMTVWETREEELREKS